MPHLWRRALVFTFFVGMLGSDRAAGETNARPKDTRPTGQLAAIDYVAPPGQDVSGAVIVLHYPAKNVSLPGKGADVAVRDRVDSMPADATVAVYGLDDALRVVIARGSPIPSGRLFRVTFDRRG